MQTILNIHELAERLGVTTHTIKIWIKKGQIPYKKLGRKYFFIWEDIFNIKLSKVDEPEPFSF
jgi:excisionase family DNA binding protein